jgi:type IV pilus assembly protein PilP
MIKSFASFLGLILFGSGIILSLWLSTSMLGRAYSQNGAPNDNIPAPSDGTLPPEMGPPQNAGTPPPALPPGPGNPQNAGVPSNANPNMGAPQPAPGASAPTAGNVPPAEEVPIFQNPEGYSYDPTGRRDPFRPYGQSQATIAPNLTSPDQPFKPGDPLQQFDVSQLKVVGIMWEVRNPKAMVKDPVGKLHMIQRQSRIGRNNGFVAVIREGEIVVVEPSISENGLQTATTRVLTLTR